MVRLPTPPDMPENLRRKLAREAAKAAKVEHEAHERVWAASEEDEEWMYLAYRDLIGPDCW